MKENEAIKVLFESDSNYLSHHAPQENHAATEKIAADKLIATQWTLAAQENIAVTVDEPATPEELGDVETTRCAQSYTINT
ncbi:hypothetical protein RRG08_009281 [Elysia crispata]|uniref:Uncharacterized protein n=1 Tax=Elysia crispata TaxID=231223 RepID=A0AAE0YET6_9GAST|nr:hypothetical protein RRG08_009281 [Elysia crispata]